MVEETAGEGDYPSCSACELPRSSCLAIVGNKMLEIDGPLVQPSRASMFLLIIDLVGALAVPLFMKMLDFFFYIALFIIIQRFLSHFFPSVELC